METPGNAPGNPCTGKRPLAALVLTVTAACCLEMVSAEDWPVYLGPNRNGASSEKGINFDALSRAPSILWRRSLGASFSPPVVAGGRLVIAHRIDDAEIVECLDATSGRPIWASRYPTTYVDRYRYNGGPRSSPAIDGDRVYTYGAEGVLSCWDLLTGKTIWQRQLNAELNAPREFFGVGTPPLVEGGILLLNPGGPNGAGLVGLDKRTGKLLWRTSEHGAGYSAPLVARIHGTRVGLFFTKAGFLAVRPADGRVLHEFAFRSPLRESVNAASPVVVGDRVFLSAAYGVGAVLLRLGPDALRVVWRDRDAMRNHWATSIHHDGFLYGIHGRHPHEAVMRCLDWETGAVRWTSPRLRERLTFILVDGHFIAMGEQGFLRVIEVNPHAYVEKSRIRVLKPPCRAPPVLANGLLYVRNETELLCIDLRTPDGDTR